MRREACRFISKILLGTVAMSVVTIGSGGTVSVSADDKTKGKDKEVTLRICNWEEYIDEGDWDEDEEIELEDGTVIFGENNILDDFKEWYYDTYGVVVNVEYSTFGTNEELYNQLNLGDVYDLVCPSDYMIMKLMVDEEVEPFDKSFFDESNELNYYVKGVSPYIKDEFEKNKINGEPWSKYAAGYMWGVTGIVYNPDEVTYEEASTWSILQNEKFNRQVTIKDNVRDAYFAAMGIYKKDLLMDKSFTESDNYHDELSKCMNDVSKDTIDDVEDVLKDIKDNVYSFETDSGKSDMVTGKVVANFQWSGDAVYALDQADEDDFYLEFAVPKECSNLWFDGWVMLKKGIGQDEDKKQAAQAFVNFMSRPDNVVRNMYYIGYTSVISGGDDSTVFDYAKYCYEAEEESEDNIAYDVSYFFGNDSDEEYIIEAEPDAMRRQLFAQYPTKEVIARSAIMNYFDDDASVNINQMWINVRCFDLKDIPESVKGMLILVFVIPLVVIKIKYGGYRRRISS